MKVGGGALAEKRRAKNENTEKLAGSFHFCVYFYHAILFFQKITSRQNRRQKSTKRKTIPVKWGQK